MACRPTGSLRRLSPVPPREVPYTGAVEGPTDEVALRCIAEAAEIDLTLIYVTNGKANLLKRLRGFNEAARFSPWVVLIDLNGAVCPPELLRDALGTASPLMRCRVVVRALEAWLLADSDHLSDFLGVRRARVPDAADELRDPKLELVNLAAHSRKRAIREDMTPREGSGRRVGPNYEGRLIEFMTAADRSWRPAVAAQRSESLRRCLLALSG